MNDRYNQNHYYGDIMADRKSFLKMSAGVVAVGAFGQSLPFGCGNKRIASDPKLPFKISLAQWSLHRAFFGKGVSHKDQIDFVH